MVLSWLFVLKFLRLGLGYMIKLRSTLFIAVLFSSCALADDSTITTHIYFPNNPQHLLHQSGLGASQPKDIVLSKVELSEKRKKQMAQSARELLLSHSDSSNKVISQKKSGLPSSVHLGMNNVPVFDQGPHATGSTFAVTAAMDAALKKGNYISQLCQLQLGNYLEKNGYQRSGWGGSDVEIVLAQMRTFGFVPKAAEESGCGGFTSYPIQDENNPTSSISPEEYRQISQPLLGSKDHGDVDWGTLFDAYAIDYYYSQQTLDHVKSVLKTGDRIILETLLWDPNLGIVGALGTNKAPSDTWVLTKGIKDDISAKTNNIVLHQMVITGYDDSAVAIDKQGVKHRGLLTLRNSWGDLAGNGGDFYMSYDYFKISLYSLYRIR